MPAKDVKAAQYRFSRLVCYPNSPIVCAIHFMY